MATAACTQRRAIGPTSCAEHVIPRPGELATATAAACVAAATHRHRASTKALLRHLGLIDGAGFGHHGASVFTEVELQHKHITAAQAKKLCSALRECSTITCLKVGCNELGDEGAESVAQAMERHLSLATLDLGFNLIGDRGAMALAQSLRNNRRLQTLYLSGNCISEMGAQALASGLAQNRSLTVLHLTGNSIGPEGAIALAEGLVANHALQKLYLAGNAIGPRGSRALFAALAANTGLRSLYLSDNGIGDQGMLALAQVLQRNRSLAVLELGFNGITHKGVEYLFGALCGYTSLQALHLDNNMIGDVGTDYAAAALPLMALGLLDVGFNAISTAGVRSLMRALGTNRTLKSLTLSGNQLDTEGAKAVAAALAANSTLRELYLDHTAISHAGERFIAAGLDTNRLLSLRSLTGFRIGPMFGLESFTNEQTLEILRNRAGCPQAKAAGGEAPFLRSPKHVESGGAIVQPRVNKGPIPPGPAMPIPPTTPPSTVHCNSVGGSGGGNKSARGGNGALPAPFVSALVDCARQPFDPSELFVLHQHFWSPPPNPVILKEKELDKGCSPVAASASQSSTCSTSTHRPAHAPAPSTCAAQPPRAVRAQHLQQQQQPHAGPRLPLRVDSEDQLPPTKRRCSPLTKTRIANYPRLKAHLELLLKSGSHENAVLCVLRQLRYVEDLAATNGLAPSAVDVESLLLDLSV